MTDHKFIRRDDNPGAVINTDKSALMEYKAKKAQSSRINNMENRMNNIEAMLEQILNKLKD